MKVFEISTGNCQLVLSGPHVAAVSAIEIIYNNSDKNWEDKKRVKSYKMLSNKLTNISKVKREEDNLFLIIF